MDPNTKLSAHFTYEEFRCKCGCNPSTDIVARIKAVAEALEHVRDAINLPVKVVSGYRCEAHNRTIPNSAKNSRHIQGDAADFQVVGWSGKQLAVVVSLLNELKLIPDGGIGIYPDRPASCHIDLRGVKARWYA